MTAQPALAGLYPAAILEHSRRPRNRRVLPGWTHSAHSENPACGDEIAVFLSIDARGAIADIAFTGQCCAIATASASVMTEAVLGKTLDQSKTLAAQFQAMVTDAAPPPHTGSESGLDSLSTLSAIRDYPARETCALLAWNTLLLALANPRG